MTSPQEFEHCAYVAHEIATAAKPLDALEITDVILDQRRMARLDMRDSVLTALRGYDELDTIPMTAEVLLVTLIEQISAADFGVP